MENRLVFGDGEIAISPATQDGIPIVLFERGLGSGEVGEKVPSRQNGMSLPADDVDKVACVFEFKNAESAQVVIDALENVKGSF